MRDRYILRKMHFMAAFIAVTTSIAFAQESGKGNVAIIDTLSSNAAGQLSEYQLDIEPSVPPNHGLTLSITCVSRCASKVPYREEVWSDKLSGAYDLGAGFMTIWPVGDGLYVRVYHVGTSGISKVLESPCKSFPTLSTTIDGKPEIIMQDKTVGELQQDEDTGIVEQTYRVQGSRWVWDGHTFRRQK